jgi:hypothetical protein
MPAMADAFSKVRADANKSAFTVGDGATKAGTRRTRAKDRERLHGTHGLQLIAALALLVAGCTSPPQATKSRRRCRLGTRPCSGS